MRHADGAARRGHLYLFTGPALQEAGGHLAATGIVDADEENGWYLTYSAHTLLGQAATSPRRAWPAKSRYRVHSAT